MNPYFPAHRLAPKLLLVLLSLAVYWLIAQLAEAVEWRDSVSQLLRHAVAAAFGVLVMGPYAADRRGWRIAALAAASVLIYYLAIRFVVAAPAGLRSITTFALAGAGASLLAALSVAWLAPKRLKPETLPLALVAGALGGLAFDLVSLKDPLMLAGHGAWQLLTCLALHWGFRRAPA